MFILSKCQVHVFLLDFSLFQHSVVAKHHFSTMCACSESEVCIHTIIVSIFAPCLRPSISITLALVLQSHNVRLIEVYTDALLSLAFTDTYTHGLLLVSSFSFVGMIAKSYLGPVD